METQSKKQQPKHKYKIFKKEVPRISYTIFCPECNIPIKGNSVASVEYNIKVHLREKHGKD